jgi:4-amino-4-deoxy-L-arabinose transferase-like glycosyltransferase
MHQLTDEKRSQMKTILFERSTPAATGFLALIQRYGIFIILGVAAILAVINLPYAPRTWYDEGSHLHVPKTLVQDGVYADKSAEGYRFHGPTIGVGPTVMLPIAGVFKLFGIGLTQGRAVIAIYMLVALVAFFAFTQRFQGHTVALLAMALLIASRTRGYEGLIEYGRQVLGEVPGLAFMLLGLLAWVQALKSLERARQTNPSAQASLGLCIAAGLGLGLALLTKNQFVLIIPPALGLIALLDWRYYRAADWRFRLIPPIVACLCFGILTFLQYQFLGAGTFMKTVEETRKAAGGAIFVFNMQATLRAGFYLIRPDLYGGLLLPALAYTIWRARQKSAQGLIEAACALLVGLWLAWFVGASLGWPRYAFPAVALGAIGVARLLVDVFTLAFSRRHWLAYAVACYAFLAITGPLALTTLKVFQPDDSAQRFAAYLDTTIPKDSLIATWEQELGFLTEHRYQYPPQSLLADAVQYQWFGGTPVTYNWEADHPRYVIIGPFGDYTKVFSTPGLERDYQKREQIGPYSLFERTAP